MPTLQIFLLQSPTVLWDDATVPIQRRAVRNLLFFLACQAEIDRSRLCTLFWPDLDEENSRPLLRTTLAKLRSALPDPSLLVTRGEILNLDKTRVWVDVLEYRELVKNSLRTALNVPQHTPLPQPVAQQLRRAANLWSAKEFWPGADFYDQPDLEEWLRDLRSDVEFSYLRILERLAHNAAAIGDYNLALMRAQRALQLDSLNDNLHEHMVNWLIESGQRSRALEHCQSMCNLYQREGTSLPENLARLCESTRALVGTSQTAPPDPWHRSSVSGGPYISRPALEQTIRQAYQRGGILLLQGETGVGKTRLLAEVTRGLEPAPRLILASSHYNEYSSPFQSLISALRRQVLQAEWLSIDQVWAAQIARVMPELLTLRPEISTTSPLAEDESAYFEAFRQLLQVLGQSRKVLLIFDSAQWHDPVSLRALTYLCNRTFFNQNALLVLAYRPEEESPALRQCLQAPHTGIPLHKAVVPPFSTDEVEQLAYRLLGYTLSPQVMERLLRETGGNPLFLVESLYLLLNQGLPDLNLINEDLPLGSNLQSAARERLSRLSPIARQVVGVAAVIGEDFMASLIESAGNFSPEQVVDALEELTQARLIRLAENPHHRHIYEFIYSSIRKAILLEMSPARQRMLNLRVARALEAAHDPLPEPMLTRLARHYEAAGEGLAALRIWIDAGKFSLRLFSPLQAEEAFQRAESLLTGLITSVPDELVYDLYQQWISALVARGDSQQLRTLSTRLLDLGERRLSPLLCACALNGLAREALYMNKVQDALRFCDRATFYLEQAGNAYELVKLNNLRGDCYFFLDQYPAALEAFTKSTSQQIDPQDSRLLTNIAHAQYGISEVLLAMGWPARAMEQALGCLKTSAQAKLAAWSVKAHTMLVLCHYYIGNIPQALEHARQGKKLAEMLQSKRNLAYLAVAEARCYLLQGWVDECLRSLKYAEEITRQLDLPRALSWIRSERGQAYRYLRQFEKARQEYTLGLQHSVFTLDRLECQFRMGSAMLEASNIQEGTDLLRATLASARAVDLELLALLAEISLLFQLFKFGHLEEARALLPDLSERAQGRQVAGVDVGLHYVQAVLARLDGDHEQARAHLRRAVQMAAERHIFWWEITTWVQLAKLGDLSAEDHARIQDLFSVTAEHCKDTPEVTSIGRLWTQWIRKDLGYT